MICDTLQNTVLIKIPPSILILSTVAPCNHSTSMHRWLTVLPVSLTINHRSYRVSHTQRLSPADWAAFRQANFPIGRSMTDDHVRFFSATTSPICSWRARYITLFDIHLHNRTVHARSPRMGKTENGLLLAAKVNRSWSSREPLFLLSR